MLIEIISHRIETLLVSLLNPDNQREVPEMINNLQALRALAAVSVVLFHIIGTSASYGQGTGYLTLIKGWGDCGVDLFFVISGFVMMQSQFSQRRTFSRFVTMRLVRIVPLYWSLTATLVLLGSIYPKALREIIITPSWTLASFGFLSQAACGRTPILSVGWTLEWEMVFYLAFASSLFLRSLRSMALWVVTVMVLLACVFREWLVLEFVLGIGSAWAYRRWPSPGWKAIVMLGLGSLALLAASLPIVRDLGLSRFLVFGIPSVLVLNGAIHCQQTQSGLLVYLGDASYSIYLLQVFAIPAFYKLSSKFLVGISGDILALICLVFATLSGCLVHSLYERRLTLWLRSVVESSPRPSA